MKKLLLSLSLTSIILAQNPNQSISARLAGNRVAQQASANTKIKKLVDCVCEHLFPALQEVLAENKAEVKEIIKVIISSKHLNKIQLKTIKAELQQAQPLLIEGVQTYGTFFKLCFEIKQFAIDVLEVSKKLIVAKLNNDQNQQEMLAIENEFAKMVATSATNEQLMLQLDRYKKKVSEFADTWSKENHEIGEALRQALTITEEQAKDEAFMQAKQNEMVELAQMLMDGVQNLLVKGLSNKRAMKLQAEVMPFVQQIQNQEDFLRLTHAVVGQLDSKVVPLIESAEKFALFAVPFLVPVITEAIDELVQTMPE